MRNALIFPAVMLVLCGAIVLVGGRFVAGPDTVTMPIADPLEIIAEPAGTAGPSPALQAPPPAISQPAVPRAVASSGLEPDAFEREAPRAPLSTLSLALPAKPKPLKDPKLYRPVAVESAVVEAMGRRVSIAGADSIAPDEICVSDGVSWPCGVRARTAFRLWLRGRAMTCDLPDGTEADPIVAPCKLGKQDVGAWLVSNGWARAKPGGPYVQAGQVAQKARMGIFGAPPDAAGISGVPDTRPSAPLLDHPVLAEPSGGPQPEQGPQLEFPPAPPAP